MKDEEMAEQFADNISGLELTCSVLASKDKNHAYRLGRYDGFLAGLKAGRPQWHKVKDGLPKESGRYLVYVGGGEKGVYPLDFETEYNDFGYWCLIINSASLGVTDTVFETTTERNEDKVIAWCELPTFDKE